MSPPVGEVVTSLVRAESIPEMLDDLEEYLAKGNRSGALLTATEIVEKEPGNVEALWVLLNCGLPEVRRDGSYRVDPTLIEAAKGWNLSQKIVKLDPTHRGAWYRGAILATQHLGLAEEVLQWWEKYRVHFPSESVPLIEQAALLIRLGEYDEASRRIAELQKPGMEELPRNQLFRADRMTRTIQRFYEMEKVDVFRPQNENHSAWKDIDGMRNLKPSSDRFTFFMLAGPLVIWEALALQYFMPKSFCGFGMAFMLVYASILWVRKISISLVEKRNRPVLDLWRAIELEAASGKVCISQNIRDSRLYKTVMLKDYPVAFRQRIEKIVENDEALSNRWDLRVPEWETFDLSEDEEE